MMMYPYAESLMDPKGCASKRVSRACDRCRLKKTKCDGRRCCNRCLADDAICVFSKRKRSSDRPYSSEYVQLLEDQQMKLVEGVQELYRRLRRGEGWTGPTIAEDSQGYPLVQDVLDSLAVLAPCERRNVQRKDDKLAMTDLDEDEEPPVSFDRSTRNDSLSPPPSPPECSQSSATSSPIDDYTQERSAMNFMTAPYQQLTSKPVSLGINTCSPNPMLQCQPMIADGSEYWPMTSSCVSAGSHTEFGELMDPFHNVQFHQDSTQWHPGNYVLM